MRKLILGALIGLPMLIWGQTIDQKSVSSNMQDVRWGTETHVIPCASFGVTQPLRDLIQESSTLKRKEKEQKEAPDKRDMPVQTFEYNVMEHGANYGNESSIVQTQFGKTVAHEQNRAMEQNWAGQSPNVSFRPFDPSGAAGPNHYIQMINGDTYEIWDKSGNSYGAASISALWSPAKGDGDPIVLYDKAADRWFMSQFGGGGDNGIYIAISQTADPLGSWYTYEFLSPDFPDYLKFSAWQDGYYMTANYAEKIFAFNRDKMLAGDGSAEAVYQTFSPPSSGFFVPLPADASDGIMPGSGTPCPIFSYSDNGWGGGNVDAVNIYNASVNWSGPSMTITTAANLGTDAFDASYDNSWDDISQPGVSQKLDGIGGCLMFRAQWRTWSGYNTVVLNWAVEISASQRGIFWCELRQDQATDDWSIYQQGIYAPGTDSYWMGSIAMNNNGDIGLSYAKASTSTYMSLAYTGRYAADPLGTMPITEVVAMAGAGSQTGMNRVGDYAQSCLDPDGETFWHTGEYLAAGGDAKTRIYSYKFIPTNLPTVSTDAASSITLSSAVSGGEVTLDGGSAVIARGIVWSLNSNPTLSDNVIADAGSGLGTFVSNISGLSGSTTYNVRAYATNANGTAYGINQSFSTLCGEITAYPFTEGFEGAAFPPACWTTFRGTNNIGTANDWTTTATTNSGTGAAFIEYENVTGGDAEDWLVTPNLILPNTTASISYFERQGWTTDYGGEYAIKISTGSQTDISSYTDLISYTESDLTTAYVQRTIDLSAYLGQTVHIAFVMTNDDGDNWYVDDINIDGTSTGVVAPVAAFSGTPTTICEGSSVVFTDASTNAPTGWSWDYGDATTNGTTQNPTHTYANAGTYTVTLTANNSGGSDDEIKIDYITVVAQPDAGTNGTLTVCVGTTPSDAELFAELGGSPDAGGNWSNSGLVYTYTVSATTPCTGNATATVTLTEQAAPNAGTNGTLTVCEGTTPTDAELFAELGGSPESGGTWSNSGLVYTYTVSATSPCTGNATATITVTEQAAPNAGTNGTLTVCEGTTPSDAELFAELGGSPDAGGTWSNSGLVYTYTISATTPCTGNATATVTITEQAAPNAGTNGTLTVCVGTTPSDAELFAELGGSPETGGNWSNSGLVYTYTVSATTPCTGNATATVTITEQAAPNAGTNGTLTVCEGTTPTDAELFAELGGSPETGGNWSNSGLVYTYTVSATTPCTGNATATVTVTIDPLPQVSFDIDASGEPIIQFTNTSTGADSYSWDLGDGTTETTTDVSHEYTDNNTFTIILSATNPCGTVSDQQTVTITNIGITSLNNSSIKIFPNPTETILNVKLPVKNTKIQLISMEGKILKSIMSGDSQDIQINVEDISSGVYNLVITTEEDEQVIVKVVKK